MTEQQREVNLIEVYNVTKQFRETRALSQVTVTFERGKIHGLVGRNGSGKTVLLKCICGFMSPSRGEVFVDGKKVDHACPKDMGIILEEPGFIGSLSGFRNLKMLASVKGELTDGQIREVLERVGLDSDSKKKVRAYSLGMRHRLGIAQAIMERPKALLLDEPMNGLDRGGVMEMRKLFLELKEQGATIVLASHYMEDIEELCDTVHEMDQGKIRRLS